MLRRRNFAYSVLYAVGVASGYLFFECNKYLISSILLVSLALIVREIDFEYKPKEVIKERLIMIAILLIGFSLFTFKYIQMHQILNTEDGKRISCEEINSIEGVIKNIQTKENEGERSYRLVVAPTNIKGSGDIQVSYYQDLGTDVANLVGNKVRLYGQLEVPDDAMNPGCFNYRTYLYSKNISHVMKAKLVKVHSRNDSLYWKYIRKSNQIREKFLNQFKNENRGFIKGVIFGDKSDIDEETIAEFNTNSTGHILAVSGLHIGFLFSLLKIVTRRKKSKWISSLIIIVILMYGEMTGWSASTERAVIVLGLSMLARYIYKPIDLLSLVSTASIIILTHNPYQLINSGFQMSFLALLGIAFLSPPLRHFVGETLGTMLAIQFAIIPITAYSFSGINLLAIFINIPIIFLASILVPVCIIGLVSIAITGVEPIAITVLISRLSSLIVAVNSTLSFKHALFVDVKGINIGVIVAVYVALFFLSSEWVRIKLLRDNKKEILRVVPLLIVPCICIGLATYNPFINDELVFVSVGQGDCTHIRYEGHNVLIDGGGDRKFNVGENILKPYLLKNGALNIDMSAVTHLHMDHFKGIEELCEVYPVGAIAVPISAADSYTDNQGIKLITLAVGENVQIGNNAYIEPIWPLDKSSITANDANENNMVYIIHINDKKILITGDMEENDELKLVEHYKGTKKLRCDVLKVGHHGSKSSSSEKFLEAVNPEIAVISVGKNNMYGHPHQEVLDRLKNHDINVYRTDINGAVGIDIKGNNIKIDTMK